MKIIVQVKVHYFIILTSSYNLRLYKTYESKASWFQTLFSSLPIF